MNLSGDYVASMAHIETFLSVKPLLLYFQVHEMTGSEEVGTFYLILKPVPEDITISAVMRVLIERQFPVRKIKRISNKASLVCVREFQSLQFHNLEN